MHKDDGNVMADAMDLNTNSLITGIHSHTTELQCIYSTQKFLEAHTLWEGGSVSYKQEMDKG